MAANMRIFLDSYDSGVYDASKEIKISGYYHHTGFKYTARISGLLDCAKVLLSAPNKYNSNVSIYVYDTNLNYLGHLYNRNSISDSEPPTAFNKFITYGGIELEKGQDYYFFIQFPVTEWSSGAKVWGESVESGGTMITKIPDKEGLVTDTAIKIVYKLFMKTDNPLPSTGEIIFS